MEPAEVRKAKAPRRQAPPTSSTPTTTDVDEAVWTAAGGRGADVSFECAGIDAVLATAIRSTRVGGTVVNVAIWGAPTSIQMNDLVFREAHLTGIIGYLNDYPATIGLLADNLIDVGFFITKRIKLDELVDGGFHELIQNKDEHVKVLVQP